MASEGDYTALLFRARTRFCALPVAQLREVMRPLPVSPLPEMPPFVLGVARIRGEAVPVADAGVLVGEEGAPAFSRYVTLRAGEALVAIAVEAVIGVRRLDPAMFRRLPPLLRGAGRDAVSAIGTLDAELLSVLKLGRSLTDRMLAALDLREAAP